MMAIPTSYHLVRECQSPALAAGNKDVAPASHCWYTGGSHLVTLAVSWGLAGGNLLIKIVLREKETIQEGVRRFRKLFERSGLKRELRRRERYEKPSDVKRKAKDRAIRRSKKQLQGR